MKHLKIYESYHKKDPDRMDKLNQIVDSLQDVFDEYDIGELKGSYQDAAEGEIFYLFDNDFTQDTTIEVGIPNKRNIPSGYSQHYINNLYDEIEDACTIAEKRTGYKIGISTQNLFGYYVIFIYPMWETGEFGEYPKHLETYEMYVPDIIGLFKGELKPKPSTKPYISQEILDNLISDCIIPLRDNGLDIKREYLYPAKDRLETTIISISMKNHNGSSGGRDYIFDFKDIKHEVLQFHNMLSEYNVNINFTLDSAFKWEYKGGVIKYKDMLKGLYDKIKVNRFTIDISIPL